MVSFNILAKKGRNIEENLLIEQICHFGAILYASPCTFTPAIMTKVGLFWFQWTQKGFYITILTKFFVPENFAH